MRREETAGEGGNRELSWLLGEGRLGVSLVQWPLVCGGLRPPGAPTLFFFFFLFDYDSLLFLQFTM